MEESYDRKNQYCGNWEMRIVNATYEFEYGPLEAAICHGKYFRRDLKFLKMLKKNNFLLGIDLLAEKFVFWAVSEMKSIEALEFVLSIISRQPLYSHYDLQYESLVHDPIHYAIRVQDLLKLKVCMFIFSSKISNFNILNEGFIGPFQKRIQTFKCLNSPGGQSWKTLSQDCPHGEVAFSTCSCVAI
jgi:hypothetical protein